MKILAAILLGIFLISCHKSVLNGITKIELAKGACFGPCIPMAISIDDSFHYKFYADSSPTWNKVRPKKYIVSYIGKANQQLWDELIKKLDSIDYKHFDTSKDTNIVDVQYMELIIYSGRNKIRIKQPVTKLYRMTDFFDNSRNHVKLKLTQDTLHFGTKLQCEYQYMKSVTNKILSKYEKTVIRFPVPVKR